MTASVHANSCSAAWIARRGAACLSAKSKPAKKRSSSKPRLPGSISAFFTPVSRDGGGARRVPGSAPCAFASQRTLKCRSSGCRCAVSCVARSSGIVAASNLPARTGFAQAVGDLLAAHGVEIIILDGLRHRGDGIAWCLGLRERCGEREENRQGALQHGPSLPERPRKDAFGTSTVAASAPLDHEAAEGHADIPAIAVPLSASETSPLVTTCAFADRLAPAWASALA